MWQIPTDTNTDTGTGTSTGTGTGTGILTDNLGIGSVTALIVGNVIGMSIFVLPGQLAAQAGPGVVLAVFFAALPALFVVVFNAQLGSAMPVAGGYYVYISRLVSPFWGFLIPWIIPPAIWAAVMFPATGLVEYVNVLVEVPVLPLAYAFIVLAVIVNLLGIRIVARVQIAMVAILFLAIGAFVVFGIPNVSAANYSELFPNGFGAFGTAVVALYFPYIGFTIITEIGEEIDDPGRTIPRVLFAGIAVVVVVFALLIGVFVGLVDTSTLNPDGLEAAIATAAGQFLPSSVVV
ncbi:MAG: APC family permease, partial [Halobacteria archaeon]|nr:APC family permease [Halobacteria archaeon]